MNMNTQYNTAYVSNNNTVVALNLGTVSSVKPNWSLVSHNAKNLAKADEILNEAPALFLIGD